jgi:hypothetical protein
MIDTTPVHQVAAKGGSVGLIIFQAERLINRADTSSAPIEWMGRAVRVETGIGALAPVFGPTA